MTGFVAPSAWKRAQSVTSLWSRRSSANSGDVSDSASYAHSKTGPSGNFMGGVSASGATYMSSFDDSTLHLHRDLTNPGQAGSGDPGAIRVGGGDTDDGDTGSPAGFLDSVLLNSMEEALDEVDLNEPDGLPPDAVRITVQAVGVCRGDVRHYEATNWPVSAVDIPVESGIGHAAKHDRVGIVEVVGPGVCTLEVGDKVMLAPRAECAVCSSPTRYGECDPDPNIKFYARSRDPHGNRVKRTVDVPADDVYKLPRKYLTHSNLCKDVYLADLRPTDETGNNLMTESRGLSFSGIAFEGRLGKSFTGGLGGVSRSASRLDSRKSFCEPDGPSRSQSFVVQKSSKSLGAPATREGSGGLLDLNAELAIVAQACRVDLGVENEDHEMYASSRRATQEPFTRRNTQEPSGLHSPAMLRLRSRQNTTGTEASVRAALGTGLNDYRRRNTAAAMYTDPADEEREAAERERKQQPRTRRTVDFDMRSESVRVREDLKAVAKELAARELADLRARYSDKDMAHHSVMGSKASSPGSSVSSRAGYAASTVSVSSRGAAGSTVSRSKSGKSSSKSGKSGAKKKASTTGWRAVSMKAWKTGAVKSK